MSEGQWRGPLPTHAPESEARVRVYIEPRDWWVGYYRGDTHHYVCPLPCVVIRWKRRA